MDNWTQSSLVLFSLRQCFGTGTECETWTLSEYGTMYALFLMHQFPNFAAPIIKTLRWKGSSSAAFPSQLGQTHIRILPVEYRITWVITGQKQGSVIFSILLMCRLSFSLMANPQPTQIKTESQLLVTKNEVLLHPRLSPSEVTTGSKCCFPHLHPSCHRNDKQRLQNGWMCSCLAGSLDNISLFK